MEGPSPPAESTDDWRSRIEANLALFERIPSPALLVRAAVAIALLRNDDGEVCIPLLLRAAGLARHAGQMALPGGKLDAGERSDEAALRELREELGLEVSAQAIVGSLDDFETRSGFIITPVVVWSGAPAAGLEPSADEVAQLYVVSMRELRSAVAAARRGTSRAFSLRFSWGRVYAPTAAILYQFSEVALEGRSPRVNDFYQPPFTHR